MCSNIRSCHQNDYDRLIKIWEASVRATHAFLGEKDILFYREQILNHWFDTVSLFAIYKNSETAGFIGLSGTKIEMLFIDPDHQKKGFGQQLVRFACDRYRVNRVDVNEQNPAALGFYQHLGFEMIGRDAVDDSGNPFPILHLAHFTHPAEKADQ